MKLGDARHPLAELEIAMKGGEISSDAFDQPRINGLRNVERIEARLQRTLVVTRLRVERCCLHVGVHQRSEGSAILAHRSEESFHDFLGHFADRRCTVKRECRLVELCGLAIAQSDDREWEIGVREDTENAGW